MGLLSEGSPLSWEETKQHDDHVRRHGIRQFIHQYNKVKNWKDVLRWVDEVEYMLVKFSDEEKNAKIKLEADRCLKMLQKKEKSSRNDSRGTWRPEYGAHSLESSPMIPYGGTFADFNMVETSMKQRRQEIQHFLEQNEVPLTLTTFPRTGCSNFTEPPAYPTPTSGFSQSMYLPDEFIYHEHPKFATMTRNIRERRGSKTAINIPVYRDKYTESPFTESSFRDAASKPNHVYMDCMGFGWGIGSIQATLQAYDITEAKHLYDQLIPLCPVMLALSAASPIYKGYLVDIDSVWTVSSQAGDDRTEEERGLIVARQLTQYFSTVGEPLSRHLAHLFIRDPLFLYREKIHQNDEEDTDHFENIQSTNYQSLRFKLPPPKSDIGWRIEFRAMDIQITDFENAAFVVFIILITRVILTYDLQLIIPMSKVEENMKKAQKRDAVLQEKFYFKRDIFTASKDDMVSGEENIACREKEWSLLSINDIMNGNTAYPGLIPMARKYIAMINGDIDSVSSVSRYLSFISKKASGEIKTTSRWIRDFVHRHPDYQQDSVVSDVIYYDLLKTCAEYSVGKMSLSK